MTGERVHASPLRETIALPSVLGRFRKLPFLLYGVLSGCLGAAMYMAGIALSVPRIAFGLDAHLLRPCGWLVWYSGVPVSLGIAMGLFDLFVLLPGKRAPSGVRREPIGRRVTVALTAYNDERSIGAAVRDFASHPRVNAVIVVSNASSDATLETAAEAGAVVFDERLRGYGRCVHRCLTEALRIDRTGLVVLCEGDRTFRAYDIDKMLAYAPHADVVNGTRTIEKLREYETQLSTIMYYGNLFVGKLLEAKHLGKCTVTDMGTTYKMCRTEALARLLPMLDPSVNLEFNAHFLDVAMESGFTVVECPITFHPRVGVSKGGNVNDRRALAVGLRMIRGMVFGWGRR